jgi:hypothetical protein
MQYYIGVYTLSLLASNLPTGSRTEILYRKIIISDLWSLGNKTIDRFTNRKSTPKKKLSA